MGRVLNWAVDRSKSSRQFLCGIGAGVLLTVLMLWTGLGLLDRSLRDFSLWLLGKDTPSQAEALQAYAQTRMRILEELQERPDRHPIGNPKTFSATTPESRTAQQPEVVKILNCDNDLSRLDLVLTRFLLEQLAQGTLSHELQALTDSLLELHILVREDKPLSCEQAGHMALEAYKKAKAYEQLRLELLRYLVLCNFQLGNDAEGEYWLREALSIQERRNPEYAEYVLRHSNKT